MAIGFAIHKAKRKVSPDLVARYRSLPVANISDVMSRIAGTNRLRPMHAGGWLGGGNEQRTAHRFATARTSGDAGSRASRAGILVCAWSNQP